MRSPSRYWAHQPNLTHQERCDGLLHSVRATVDGVSAGMPSYELHVSVHPDDEALRKAEVENLHQIGLKLPTDRMWHDALFEKNH